LNIHKRIHTGKFKGESFAIRKIDWIEVENSIRNVLEVLRDLGRESLIRKMCEDREDS
jgi:hypothetical protein